MDELTESERERVMSWRPMAPPDGFADRVVAARAAHRRRRFAMAGALAVAAAAVVVVVLARPNTPDVPRSVGPVASQVAGDATSNPPVPRPVKKDVVVALPLHVPRSGARTIRVFDRSDASAIVFRVDLAGSRCSSWSPRSVSVTVTPDRGPVTMFESLESNVISLPLGAYKVDVTCAGAAETAIEVQTFDLIVTRWEVPSDPESVVVHLDPDRPFEIAYSYAIPRIIFGDDRTEFDFDVYEITHPDVRPSGRRMPTWSRHARPDAFVLTRDTDYDVVVRQGATVLGTIVIRRDQTAPGVVVRTVRQTSSERDLQFYFPGSTDWKILKTEGPSGRISCTDCRLSAVIFDEADFPIVQGLTNADFGDQYYVIR